MDQNWLPGLKDYPHAPPNVQVTSAFITGLLDIRWDNPTVLDHNKSFQVIGVNIYRSDDSEFGPYFRINTYPISSTFYRDQTNICSETELIPYSRINISEPNVESYIITTNYKIVQKSGQAIPANNPDDVEITIDGKKALVKKIYGEFGKIELFTKDYFDPVTEQIIPAVLPTENSEILVTYNRAKNFVQSGLETKSFYRVTTVALSAETPSGMVETPLQWSAPRNKFEVETLDYIWREGVRRNNWILEQGGERVKFFIKKTYGIPCYCTFDEHNIALAKHPENNCGLCLGTSWLGGYTGPFEGIIAPDDAERQIAQSEYGRNKVHSYDTWTGPAPLLTQRDFIVKQTNERYSIGPVRRPNNRGNVLQQHFNLGYLDEGDIRYRMPINGIEKLPWPSCRISGQQFYYPLSFRRQNVPYQVGPDGRLPKLSDKANIPDNRELRGRTTVWANHMY